MTCVHEATCNHTGECYGDCEELMRFDDFMLSETVRNAHVQAADGDMHLYLRKGVRSFGRDYLFSTLDIALVEVVPERRGQGLFTRFLEMAESFNYAIYVESVLNQRLGDFLNRRGYVYTLDGSNSFYRLVKGKQAHWQWVRRLTASGTLGQSRFADVV